MIHTHAYYIRKGYGLMPVRNKRELKALLDFCKRMVAEAEEFEYAKNTPQIHIYKNTVCLSHSEVFYPRVSCFCTNCKALSKTGIVYTNIYEYIAAHCYWYWS